LVGRRLCTYRANGFDGNLLRRRGLTNSHSYADSHSYSHAYCHGYSHTYTDSNTNTNSYSYSDSNRDSAASVGNANGYCNSDSDRNAHADGNINPVYGKVFTDTKTSANSGAAPVVAGRADLSAVVPRLRDEGG